MAFLTFYLAIPNIISKYFFITNIRSNIAPIKAKLRNWIRFYIRIELRKFVIQLVLNEKKPRY